MSLATVDYDASTGFLREVYDRVRARSVPAVFRPMHGGAPGVITAHSLDAPLIPRVFATSGTIEGGGPLAWAERELVAAITSRLNQSLY